jgi:hypothetical protein
LAVNEEAVLVISHAEVVQSIPNIGNWEHEI